MRLGTITIELSSDSPLSLRWSLIAGRGLDKSGERDESPNTSKVIACDCDLVGSGGTGGGKALNTEGWCEAVGVFGVEPWADACRC